MPGAQRVLELETIVGYPPEFLLAKTRGTGGADRRTVGADDCAGVGARGPSASCCRFPFEPTAALETDGILFS